MRLKVKYVSYFLKPKRWLIAIRRPRAVLRTLAYFITLPKLFRVSQNVEGLITFSMCVLLYRAVLRARSTSPNVVEIGAFKGLSTCSLSLAASRTGKRVKSFELFSGLPTSDPVFDPAYHVGAYSSDVAEYEANVTAYGCRDLVDLVIGDARRTLLPTIASDGFSVAFLDVDVYEVTKELLFQLWSIAKGGEVIIVHDVNSPGVRRAVDEFHILSDNIVNETVVEYGVASILSLPLLPIR